jgi:hypothetical protein
MLRITTPNSIPERTVTYIVCYGCKFYSPSFCVLQNYSFCCFVRAKHHLVKYVSSSTVRRYSVGVLIHYSAILLFSRILFMNFNYCLISIQRSSCPSINFFCQHCFKNILLKSFCQLNCTLNHMPWPYASIIVWRSAE